MAGSCISTLPLARHVGFASTPFRDSNGVSFVAGSRAVAGYNPLLTRDEGYVMPRLSCKEKYAKVRQKLGRGGFSPDEIWSAEGMYKKS